MKALNDMRILTDILDFFLPRTCHACGCQLLDGESYLCRRCVEMLPRSRYHQMELNPMERRFAGIVPFVRATGHFIYSRDSDIANVIHDMKYRKFPSLGRRLGEIVGEELKTAGFFDGADVIVPVPMHWSKKVRRGYNQTEHIARGLSLATGLPASDSISAVRGHRTQTAMTLEQRQRNLSGSFRVNDMAALRGKGIVLVDDVCTTGATLRTLAAEVAEGVPDCRIYLLAMAVTV